MSKIETGRFSERLRRFLGMKGVEVVSAELSPEISPVIILEDNGPDAQFLQGVRLAGSAMQTAATAGNISLQKWVNPEGSGVIAIFDYFSFTLSASGALNLGYAVTLTTLSIASVTVVRDHRWQRNSLGGTAIQVSRTSDGTAIALSESLMVSSVLAVTPGTYPKPFILLPGEALELGTQGLAVTMRTAATWSERQLPRLEQ